MKTQNTMAIFGVVKGGEKSFWTRIGTAFANRDGSLNLKLHYIPTHFAEATIQLRPIDATTDATTEAPEASDSPAA